MYNGLPWSAPIHKNGVPNQGCSTICGVRHLARRQASSCALQCVVDIPFQEGSDKWCHESDRMLCLGGMLSSSPCGIYSSLYLRLLGLQGGSHSWMQQDCLSADRSSACLENPQRTQRALVFRKLPSLSRFRVRTQRPVTQFLT